MKKIIFLTLAAVGFVSCEKDEKATVSTESANITAEVSATTFTLDKTKAGDNALTVSWNKTARRNSSVTRKKNAPSSFCYRRKCRLSKIIVFNEKLDLVAK